MEGHKYEKDEWKIKLYKEIITAMTGSGKVREYAIKEVGYYYQCFAPASLYKYYSDISENLDVVKNNKM